VPLFCELHRLLPPIIIFERDLMFRLRYLFLAVFVLLIGAACSPQQGGGVTTEGPAFILFYTEN
jgi:hypothetical protein